jgi:hypothetical protein
VIELVCIINLTKEIILNAFIVNRYQYYSLIAYKLSKVTTEILHTSTVTLKVMVYCGKFSLLERNYYYMIYHISYDNLNIHYKI